MGEGRRRLWVFGSTNATYFSFPSKSNSIFTKRRCLGLEIFTWLLSHQKNFFFLGGVTLYIQIEKIAKHDSNMKTILDIQSTPDHWERNHPGTLEVVL